jgi:uncharacterized membrane protein YhaH (DUF805 family)
MANPYSTPQAALAEPGYDGATYDPSMFSMSGRLGRVRYIVYSGVLNLLMWVVMGILIGGALMISGSMTSILVITTLVLTYAVAIFLGVILGRRRLHDLDKSGWLLCLMLVPLVNIGIYLWMLFGPGTEGPNSRGLPPPPNSQALVIGLWVTLVFTVVFAIAVNIAMKSVAEKFLSSQGISADQMRPSPGDVADQ